ILTAGLALLMSAYVIEPAHGWVNWKLGVGVNWTHQTGGNNFLWGARRNGQPPGPASANQAHPGYPPEPGYGPPGYPPSPYTAPFSGFGEGAPSAPNPNQAFTPKRRPASFPCLGLSLDGPAAKPSLPKRRPTSFPCPSR